MMRSPLRRWTVQFAFAVCLGAVTTVGGAWVCIELNGIAMTDLEQPMPLSEKDLFTIEADISQRHDEIGYESLSQPERAFLCIWDLEAQVNNGGFWQYFFNTHGNRAREAHEALIAIGARHTAAIMYDAFAVFGTSGPPAVRDDRRDLMDHWEEDGPQYRALSALDQRFYRYEDNLSDLLCRYVEAHASDFRLRESN